MNEILLIDADSTIPNLALMKLSTYYKSLNCKITLLKLNISYYPTKTNKQHNIDNSKYYKTFCSTIFSNSTKYINSTSEIQFGGTGYDYITNLPDHIESLAPDYSIYNDYFKNNENYGFITRGCIRNCYFCVVPKKEGLIHKVNDISNLMVLKSNKLILLDNNILAYSDCNSIFEELISKKIRVKFQSGFDIRLLNEENSKLISKLRYIRNYIFAFDDIKLKPLIESKLQLLEWVKEWYLKFYIYVHPNMSIKDTVDRIEFLKSNKCLCYIMRDLSCWDSDYRNFYIDIARYCNQPGTFINMSFRDFLHLRPQTKERIDKSIKLYEQCI